MPGVQPLPTPLPPVQSCICSLPHSAPPPNMLLSIQARVPASIAAAPPLGPQLLPKPSRMRGKLGGPRSGGDEPLKLTPSWAWPPPSGLGLHSVTSHTCPQAPPHCTCASSNPLTWRGMQPIVSSL